MRLLAALRHLSVFLIFAFCALGVAHAQATRTWISGVGDDANPCSRTAPCKTFQGAIAKTASGGVIDVLDPGGFGGVTVTKSITLENVGMIGGVLITGSNGITVNDVSGNAVVTLRGLSFEGLGAGNGGVGVRGVSFLSGKSLIIERCDIGNFTDASNGAGISFTPSTAAKLVVRDTTIHNNGSSAASTAGVVLRPAANGSINATLSDVRILDGNNSGVIADASFGNVTAVIRDSVISGFAANGIIATGGNGAATVTVQGSTLSNNGLVGALAQGGPTRTSLPAVIRLSGATITANTQGVQTNGGSASIASFGNNTLYGNGADGTPDSHVSLQ